MDELTVRELRPSDHEKWLALYEGYADHYQVELTEVGVSTTWAWLMDPNHPLAGIAAELDGTLAGLAHFRPMPSPLRGQDVGFLDDLFVRHESRGRGVADILISAVQQHALARGWKVVRWITRDDNYRARRVYDRLSVKSDWITYEMFCDTK